MLTFFFFCPSSFRSYSCVEEREWVVLGFIIFFISYQMREI